MCVCVALVFTLCLSLCAIHTNPVSCCNSKAELKCWKQSCTLQLCLQWRLCALPLNPSSFETSKLQTLLFLVFLLFFWLLLHFDPFSLNPIYIFVMRGNVLFDNFLICFLMFFDAWKVFFGYLARLFDCVWVCLTYFEVKILSLDTWSMHILDTR